LLSAPGFEVAHKEFLDAHKAYLHRSHKEALREALNALESTLKVICTERKWKFDAHRDTASKLLNIVFDHKLIPDYLQTEFNALRSTLEAGVPTIRNRAAGHGQGTEIIEVAPYLAAYVLHLTAAAILFLVSAHREIPISR
jgi:hypothetical protein